MEQVEFTREIVDALGAPFPEDEIEFLPRAQSNGKALGLAYIDARCVMRRLDAVVGPGNWSFDFDLLGPEGKMVKGRLTVLGVTKCDAGEAAQEDEPLKSAVSDALKRAAVHFGVGRYLYYLPRVWAPFDSQKRRFTEQPRLDPQAVRQALQICGISAPTVISGDRSLRAAPAPRAMPPTAGAAPAAAEDPGAASRKSIWAAPGAGNSAEPAPAQDIHRPAPESSGDRAAAGNGASSAGGSGASSAGSSPAPAAAGAAPGPMTCSGPECGKALTKGQHDVSLRAFGQPLCPACQKLQSRSAA